MNSKDGVKGDEHHELRKEHESRYKQVQHPQEAARSIACHFKHRLSLRIGKVT
jgi:hypothetical protein